MRYLIFLVLFPVSIWAYSPSGLDAPKIFDLSQVSTDKHQLVSVVTKTGKVADYEFDAENRLVTINTSAEFYFAAMVDSLGQLDFLYLGPDNILLQAGKQKKLSPAQAGVLTGGTGIVLCWVGGLATMSYGFNVWINDLTGPGFEQGILLMFTGAAILLVGTIVSSTAGVITGASRAHSQKTKAITTGDTTNSKEIVRPAAPEEVPRQWVKYLKSRNF